MIKYLVDSNIFINSNNRYKQKFFPVIWNLFLSNQNILIIDKVYDELCSGSDELSDFIRDNFKDRKITSANSIKEYGEVINFISNRNMWTQAGITQWLMPEKADPWLIACAKHNKYVIVTDERNTGPNGSPTDNEPKIPFVASNLGVEVIDFWGFLERINFVAN